MGLFFLARDEVKAVALFESAAKSGHQGAMATLGFAYLEGRLGLPADVERALRYLERAAALGNEEAAGCLNYLRTKNQIATRL